MSFKTLEYISIDIETMHLTDDQIEFESQFLTHRKGTKDPEKIKAQILKKKADLVEMGAVKDSSTIASIGIHSDTINPHVVHHFPYHEELDHVEHTACKNEAEMLSTLTIFLDDKCTEETVIVVAGKGFDLPKIRLSSIKNRVKFPNCMMPGNNPVYDLLYMGGKYFMTGSSAQHNVSVSELLKRFGFDREGKIVSGGEIPIMISEGKYGEVITYNGLDALDNSLLYKAMTNRL